MSTAFRIKPKPIRATIRLGRIEGVEGRIGESTLTIGDDVLVGEDLYADDEMIVLVSHMFCEGETFEGHVVQDGGRHVLIHIDELTDLPPGFDHERDPAEDPMIEAIMDMNVDRLRDGDEAAAFVLSGMTGIRLISDIVRGDDGRCDFDRRREHVLLEVAIPEEGMAVGTLAKALAAANDAEYADTVVFYEGRMAEAEGRAPLSHTGIVQEGIRARTLLAGMGLTPATTGRSYNVCDMHWIGCMVRPATDGWIEVSMKVDT